MEINGTKPVIRDSRGRLSTPATVRGAAESSRCKELWLPDPGEPAKGVRVFSNSAGQSEGRRHHTFLPPGFTAGRPCRQSGQSSRA